MCALILLATGACAHLDRTRVATILTRDPDVARVRRIVGTDRPVIPFEQFLNDHRELEGTVC